jgi:hypothetical protein
MFSYDFLCFLFNKIEEGRTGSASKQWGWGLGDSGREWESGGEMAQTMYTDMSKYKNNKKSIETVSKIVS